MTHQSCKHYGVKPGCKYTCARGVDIRKHVGGPNTGWLARSPCVTSKLSYEQVACDLREYPTAEELAAEEAEIEQVMQRFAAGLSPCCNETMTKRGVNRYCPKCGEWCGKMNCRRGTP